MEKIDLRRELRYLYSPPSKSVVVIDVPAFNYVMVDGTLHPGETPETSNEFQQSIGALYGVSYTLKFQAKLRKENPINYSVMALEGLWWVESGKFDFQTVEPWFYTLLMLQPSFITAEMYQEAVHQLMQKRPSPAVECLRFERFEEGLCVQTMHIGPYADEPITIQKMQDFMQAKGYSRRGKHHEIYLGDPRRASPDKLKTVLRQPVEAVV